MVVVTHGQQVGRPAPKGYRTLKLYIAGNPIAGDYLNSGATQLKTLYDPFIFPEASMKEFGYKAFKDAMNNNKFDLNNLSRTFEGTADGKTISGFYKLGTNGEKIISTWWIKN